MLIGKNETGGSLHSFIAYLAESLDTQWPVKVVRKIIENKNE
tara:strand:+ start:912 stop:1037 length:126 start_codon:yes stop_codon:yes gene_type:complete